MPSSPHEFFKVFLLSSDYRPSVDRPSTERWPITDRYIGEVSTNYRRSVSEKLANCQWIISERKAISAETHLERLSTVSRPSVVRLSSESRPTIDRPLYRPSVDRLSTECRPSVDRLSTAISTDTYRSTLPTVNMILKAYCRVNELQTRHWQERRIIAVRRSRRISKESSSKRMMHLVPVFILETHNQTNYKCLLKFV